MNFVSYSHAGRHGHGFGSCTTTSPMTTYAEVRALTAWIEQDNGWPQGSVVVLHWQPLPDEPLPSDFYSPSAPGGTGQTEEGL